MMYTEICICAISNVGTVVCYELRSRTGADRRLRYRTSSSSALRRTPMPPPLAGVNEVVVAVVLLRRYCGFLCRSAPFQRSESVVMLGRESDLGSRGGSGKIPVFALLSVCEGRVRCKRLLSLHRMSLIHDHEELPQDAGRFCTLILQHCAHWQGASESRI